MDMKTNKIKAWLAMHEVKQVDICKALEVGPTMVCGFIAGRQVSARLYRYFVDVLGMPRAYFDGKYGDEEEAA